MARKKVTYDLKLSLEYAAAIVRTQGYVSKKDAYPTVSNPTPADSTAVILGRWLQADPEVCAETMIPEDTQQAKKALVWLSRLSPTTEFNLSLKKLLSGGYSRVKDGEITKSDFGFVACVYSTMTRDQEKKKARAEAEDAGLKSNEYIGTIKKRDDFFVKLMKIGYSQNFGCHVYNVVDRKGNLGSFFSNDSPEALGLSLNDCFLARMTPKRQERSSYHGGKETQFNRVKVLQNVGGADSTKA